jgi:DNA repair protein RadD
MVDIKLRDYQEAAVESVFDFYSKPRELDATGKPKRKNALLCLPTASGKSLVIAELAKRMFERVPNTRIIMATHIKELIRQNAEKLTDLWPNAPLGIYSAGLKSADSAMPIVYGGIQSMVGKFPKFGHRDFLFVDECFTGETLVSTPAGQKRIDKVRLGDTVFTATGLGKILAISKKLTAQTYKVRLSDGTEIRCTGNHPFLSRGGWVEAKSLGKGACVFGIQNMPELWDRISSKNNKNPHSIQIGFRQSKILLNILFKEKRERDVDAGGKGKGIGNSKTDWAQAICSWWQRQINANPSLFFRNDGTGLDGRIGYPDKSSEVVETVSDLLQSGFGSREKETGNRIGRKFSYGETKRIGRQERQISNVVRVADITLEELGSGSFVFNLEVDGHPSYFANNTLVHNCHLVGNEGSYLKFINELEKTNPFLKIVGLSATPYRLGMGLLTNGKIFTDVVYDITNQSGFQKLIANGHLSPLIAKPGNVQIDTSQVGLDSNGEFAQGEIHKAIKEQAKTREQLSEFVTYGANRKSWVVFAAGIAEAEEINDLLNNVFGISSVVLHSKLHSTHNDGAMKAWKNGDVRCAVSMNMLCTGIDNPMLDYCGDFQPTTSTAKHVQKNGRLTRPFPGKANGLVMDYAGNFRRLGPIDDPLIPKMRGKGPAGDAPIKICKKEQGGCGFYNHASARYCGGKPFPSNEGCGREFVFQDKTTFQAFSGDAMRSDAPLIDSIKVDRVIYTAHVSKAVKAANPGALHSTLPISVKVSYYCGLRTYYEWVTVEGLGGRVRGRDWFRQRFAGEPPATNTEVLALASQLRKPETIKVWMNANPQPKVMSAEF